MNANQSTTRAETLAERHARLHDRTTKQNAADRLARFAAGLLVIGSILASLYFLAG